MPLGAAMPRQAAICPVAAGCFLERRQFGIKRGRLRVHDREAARLAGVDHRARFGQRAWHDVDAARHQILHAGAAPFDGTHGSGIRIDALLLEQAGEARCQMPPWPVPEAFSLPGLALIAASRSLAVLYGESARTVMPAGSAFTRPIGV